MEDYLKAIFELGEHEVKTQALADSLGFSPAAFHYVLLSLTSITAVGAFDAVGVVLFIAFVIVPPAAAYLLRDRLWRMILYSSIMAVLSSIIGYHLAVWWDVSIGSMMASVTGVFLLASFILSPRYGLITQQLIHNRQGLVNAQRMLLVHLYNYERRATAGQENIAAALQTHLHWSAPKAERVLRTSLHDGLVTRDQTSDQLYLTERGRQLAREVLDGKCSSRGATAPHPKRSLRWRYRAGCDSAPIRFTISLRASRPSKSPGPGRPKEASGTQYTCLCSTAFISCQASFR